MAKKGLLKENGTNEVLYPVTLSECILDGGIEIVPSTGSLVEVKPNKYYRFDEPVNSLDIVIDGDDVVQEKVATLSVFFTTGDIPQVNISSARGYGIKYFNGYSIKPNTTYELNIMWNGYNWIVAYGIID